MIKQIVSRVRDFYRSRMQTSSVRHPSSWFLEWLGHGPTDSGLEITSRSVLEFAPLYYCITRISGHIGSLPIKCKQRTPQGIRDVDPKEYNVIEKVNLRPNDLMVAQDWRETMCNQSLIWGNARSAIIRNNMGWPVEFILLRPEFCRTYLVIDPDNGDSQKWHQVTLSSTGIERTATGQQLNIPDSDMLHIKGLGPDGLVGYGLVELAKNSIGAGLAAEKHLNRTFKNNAIPGLILEAPQGAYTDDTKAKQLVEEFNQYHQGIDKTNRVALLRHGVTANPLSMPGKDAQFIEQRKFQREEAALWTAIEGMLGLEDSSAYNSVQQRNAVYRQNCLLRWFTKWEQELNRKVLTERQRQLGYFWSFDDWTLLRGSVDERIATYKQGREAGLWSQEEIRDMEGLGPPDEDDNWAMGGPIPDPEPEPQLPETIVETVEEEPQALLTMDVKRVVYRQVSRLLSHERTTLVGLAAKSKDFIERVEAALQRSKPKLAEVLDELAGPGELVEQWIDESRFLVIEACGDCTAEELRDKIEELTRTWATERAQIYADQILEASHGRNEQTVPV